MTAAVARPVALRDLARRWGRSWEWALVRSRTLPVVEVRGELFVAPEDLREWLRAAYGEREELR